MTSTASTTSTSTGTSLTQPANAVGKKDLSQTDFMTLFVTQLQYQDPMKPMDSYEMASQLAQFSNMDATTKMSDNMQKLLDFQTSQNNLQALSMLGNNVQMTGDGIAVSGGAVSPTDFTLSDAPATVQVTVSDATNTPVWSTNLPPQGAGATYTVNWDGKNAAGSKVADGAYTYQVKAMSANGAELPVTYHSTGKVTGVNFASTGTTLTVDNASQVKISDVIKVSH